MSFSRRIELVSGLATGFIWLAYSLALSRSVGSPYFYLESFLSGLISLGIPGLLVAFGAYAHAARGKAWGRVVLTVGCSLLILGFLLHLFGGTGYYGGVVLLSTFVPLLTGIITVIASRSNDLTGM